MPKIKEATLEIEKSIYFDKEEMIEDLRASVHTTEEEFDRLYTLEEGPVNLRMIDYSDLQPNRRTVQVVQEFHIRRRTPEEMAEYDKNLLTQGEN